MVDKIALHPPPAVTERHMSSLFTDLMTSLVMTMPQHDIFNGYVDGLVQDCSISSALATVGGTNFWWAYMLIHQMQAPGVVLLSIINYNPSTNT